MSNTTSANSLARDNASFDLILDSYTDALIISKELIDAVIALVEHEIEQSSAENRAMQKTISTKKIFKMDLMLAQHGLTHARRLNDPARALNIINSLYRSMHIDQTLLNELDSHIQYFSMFKRQINMMFANAASDAIDEAQVIGLKGFSSWSDDLQGRLDAIAKKTLDHIDIQAIVEIIDTYAIIERRESHLFLDFVHSVINLESRYGSYLFYLIYEFCEKTSSLESLEFLVAAQLYQNLSDDQRKLSAFGEMYQHYIHSSAKSWITLPESMRSDLNRAYQHVMRHNETEPPDLTAVLDDVQNRFMVETIARLKSEYL